MYKLISAGFYKLSKSLCFKIYLAFGFVYSVINVILRQWDIKMVEIYVSTGEISHDGYNMNADSILFDSAMTMLFAAAVFTAIFIGREYSDGTVRNKLVVGHGRSGVYLSNLIVCVTANIAATLLALAATLALGIPLLGTDFTCSEIVLRIAYMIAADIAVSAFMLFLSMLISSKAAGCATLILSMFVLLFASTYIDDRLSSPEYYTDYEMSVNENGEYSIEQTEGIKNPLYISGIQRQVYEFLDEALPMSQLYHMASDARLSDSALALGADGVILIAFTGVGILIFRKKNIK